MDHLPDIEPVFWSTSYTIENLKKEMALVTRSTSIVKTDLASVLCSCRQYHEVDSRTYYHQARHYLKVGALRPSPPFLVSLSDLSNEMVKALSSFNRSDRIFILKQAVARIFEEVNVDIYHSSVSRNLEVQFID